VKRRQSHIKNIAPLTLTVELDPTDCIALFDACMNRFDENRNPSDGALLQALGTALLGGAFAGYALADPDAPHTIRHMWEVWAPVVALEARRYGRMPVPRQYRDQEGEPDE